MLTDRRSIILLILQILPTLFVLTTGPLFIQNIPFLLTQIFGFLLIGWALLARQVNKHKELAKGGARGSFLVTKGPYEIIRHPIYAGYLLVMAGYVQGYISFLRFIAFLLFLLVTLLKMEHDEHLINAREKSYEDYKTKTHRLIPYFY